MMSEGSRRGRLRRLGLDGLMVENWDTSSRLSLARGISIVIWIEETPGGRFRTVYRTASGFEAAREFDTLASALEHANGDGDAVRVEFVENLAIADALNRGLGRDAVENNGDWEPLDVAEGLIRDIDSDTVGRWVVPTDSPLEGVPPVEFEPRRHYYDGLGDQAHHGPDGHAVVPDERFDGPQQ